MGIPKPTTNNQQPTTAPAGRYIAVLPENDIRYAYATGRIRALQKGLADEATIRRMLEAPTPEAAFSIMMETPYAAYATGAGISDYERMLEAGLADAYRLIRSISPDGTLADILIRRYDLHNAKIIIKAERMGIDHRRLMAPVGSIDPDIVVRVWRDRDWRDIPGWLGRIMYQAALMIDNSGDLYLIDLMIDKSWFDDLRLWSEERSSYLRSWLTARIDTVNIAGMLRSRVSGWSRERWREVFVEGGKVSRSRLEGLYDLTPEQAAAGLTGTDYRREIEEGLEGYREHGSLSYMEALFEARLLEALRSERYVTFGPQPLLAYLLRKEAEVRALRTVMIGKLNGLPHDTIHRRLRGFLR